MTEGLIIFENSAAAKQTVVCQCSVILTKTRETVNQVKLKLLDRFDKQAPLTKKKQNLDLTKEQLLSDSETRVNNS